MFNCMKEWNLNQEILDKIEKDYPPIICKYTKSCEFKTEQGMCKYTSTCNQRSFPHINIAFGIFNRKLLVTIKWMKFCIFNNEWEMCGL